MTSEPLRRDLDQLLRQCVQCGLCLPHCATFLATGDEVDSPRGRLVLLGAALDAGDGADPAWLEAFDRCIGCRACETACPSGVPFALLEHGQRLASPTAPPAIVPGPVLRRLDQAEFLAVLRPVAGAARRLVRALWGAGWRERLPDAVARPLGTVPHAPHADKDLVRFLDRLTGLTGTWAPPPPGAPTAGPVAFFAGCANRGLLPGTSRRVRQLLRAAGHGITVPADQDCCGALATHSGRPGRAATLRRRNETAFGGDGPVVTEAAGCGLELACYGDDWPGRVADATVLLSRAALPPLAELPLRVAIHDPCHLRHGQGVTVEPRDLLRRIPGLEVCEPDEADVCCGSGGAWGLRHPDLSADLGRRKAACLAATGADLVVTSNPGCLGQIADGLARRAPDLPILPLSDLVWYAAARAPGPRPASNPS